MFDWEWFIVALTSIPLSLAFWTLEFLMLYYLLFLQVWSQKNRYLNYFFSIARLVFFLIFSRHFLENCTYMTLVQFKSSKLTFRVGPVVLHVHPWNNIKLQEMDHLVSLRHGNTILIVLTLVLSTLVYKCLYLLNNNLPSQAQTTFNF